VVLVAGAAVAVPTMASASVNLPPKSVAEVLTLVHSSTVSALSGTVTETSDLGLPSLPTGSGAPSGDSSAISADLALITGSNSLRVYVDGPTKVRVQDLESLAERDVIRSGSNVWVYDSKDNSVAHATLPSTATHPVKPATPGATVDPTTLTPEGIATTLLAQLKSTSTLAVAQDAVSVAGRSAYDLVLTPNVSDTLLGSVSIAVDAQTGLPLRVEVAARGQKTPAVSIAFSSLTLATPAASVFEFTAPRGAKVTELTRSAAAPGSGTPQPQAPKSAKPTETLVGSGWESVVTLSAGGSLATLAQSGEFTQLTTAVPGGRVLHTTLANVLFTTDGRVIAGSVSIARLQAVANAS
jgi:outer membrane lipoprotein-sorting protein